MKSFEAQVAKRIPELKIFSERLINLTDRTLDQVLAKNSDNYGVMGVCFLNKQLDHLKGLLRLENCRDSELIARSMIEGLAYFLWATNEPIERPLLWRQWGYVYNHRQRQENPDLYKDQTPSPEGEESGQEILKKFYTEKAQNALREGRQIPQNPFVRDWTGMKISEVIKEVSDGEKGLTVFYQRFSEWHHWNFAGVVRSLDISQEGMVRYRSDSFLSYGQSIVVGFQSLYQICELVSEHFNINVTTELHQLQKEYLAMPVPIVNQP